jgi:hypothetical protein
LVAEARLVLGDLDGADAAFADMDAAFETSGLGGLAIYRDGHRQNLHGWRIVRALIAGRFSDAEAYADGLADLPAALLGLFGTTIGRTQIAYLRGDWTGATAYWEDCRRLAPALTAPYFGYLGTGGDLAELRRYWDRFAKDDPSRPAWTRPASVGVIAESLRRLGEREAAAALAAEFAHHSGYFFTNGFAWFYGPFDTALGILSTTAGNLDAAVMHLARAVEQCDDIASPSWGAIARLELATASRVRGAAGDEQIATVAATDARSAMTECGMPGWLARLDRLDAGDLEPWKIVH